MWLTLSVIMCYAFINLIQKHHLYNKDQNSFCVFFILNKIVSRYRTAGRANTLQHFSPLLGYHFLLYSLLSGVLLGRVTFLLRGSWLWTSELCFTPWLHFLSYAVHSDQCGGITPQEERCSPACFLLETHLKWPDGRVLFPTYLVWNLPHFPIPSCSYLLWFNNSLFFFPWTFLGGWLVSCVLLFLTADLGSFLVLLCHLAGASRAFGFGLFVTALNRLVLV